MTKPLTTTQFFRQFPDDETCLNHLFNVRFGQGYTCPSCERPSNWYRIKAERAYSCQWCGHHLHPTVGTPFEQTRTPLQLWFYAIHLFTTTRHGVSAKELERQLGVTYKTAWRMAGLIRQHMADVDGEEPIGGEGKTVQIDETIVGGRQAHGARGGDPTRGKTIVFGMMEPGGDVVTHIVPDRKAATLFPLIHDAVEPGTAIHTDELSTYRNLNAKTGYAHASVNRARGEYVNAQTGATVNAMENFWRHLKTSIASTHTSVSGKYLGRYAKEFEYRFNRRNDAASMLPGASFDFPAIEAKARLKAALSPSLGVGDASLSAMNWSSFPSVSALRRVSIVRLYHVEADTSPLDMSVAKRPSALAALATVVAGIVGLSLLAAIDGNVAVIAALGIIVFAAGSMILALVRKHRSLP